MNDSQIHTASRTPNTVWKKSVNSPQSDLQNTGSYNLSSFKLASSTTKRLAINFTRKRKSHEQPTFNEEIWQILADSVKKIQNNEVLSISCEKLYQYVQSICKNENTEILFNKLKNLCEDHTKTLNSQLGKGSNDEIHIKINSLWKLHCKKMEQIINIFAVLDRNYLLKHAKLPTLQDMSADLFKKHVISDSDGLKEKLVEKILDEVKSERNGKSINVALIKNLIQMLSQLGLYECSFEGKFLEETDRLYDSESKALKLDSELSIQTYLKRVEEVYNKERNRVQCYLQLNTEKRLLEIVIKHFLEKNLESILKKGMQSLVVEIDNVFSQDSAHLTLLYRLSSHYKDGHKLVATSFGQYCREKGTKIVAIKDEKAQKEMIQLLLEFKDVMDEIVKDSFEDNMLFKNTLKNECERFINSAGGEKPAQLIAAFIDAKMKGKYKVKQDGVENDIEAVLNKVMVLFRCIHGKDTFEIYYKKDLAKRLINTKSQNVDAEKNMLSKLKHECGPQFTAHLEGMFRDIETSKEVNAKYMLVNESGCFTEFSILTKSNWPTEENVDIDALLPATLKSDKVDFEKWYVKNHDGRKLAWQSNLGVVTLAFEGSQKKKHEVEVGPYQALVLLLFSDEGVNKLSFKEICEKLGRKSENEEIEKDEKKDDTEEKTEKKSSNPDKIVPGVPNAALNNAVHSLIFAKPGQRVLMRDISEKGKKPVVDAGTVVVFNKKFINDKFKFKIGSVEAPKVDKKEQKEMQKAIAEDRSFRLDAIVVRIMKTKKSLSHNDLMVEVKNEVGTAFEVVPALVKKRIENLISRDFLSRTDDQGYEYQA